MQNSFWPIWVVGLCRWLAWLSGGLVVISAAMIGIDIAARILLSRGLVDSFEVTSYGLAIAFALGLPYSIITGAHIRIDALARWRRPVLNRISDLAALLSMAAWIAFLAYFAGMTLSDSLLVNARSNSTLGAPLAIPQAVWVFGLTLSTLVAIFALVRGVRWLMVRPAERIIDAATIADDPEDQRETNAS